MASVSTSIVVQFSQGSSGGSLTAEVDSREDGLNLGKTSFSPGDTARFLVFSSSDVTIDSVVSSAGTITPLGEGMYLVEEFLTFADTIEATTNKVPYSNFISQWYGTNLGSVTVKGNTVTATTKGVGVLKVSYKAKYNAYALASPSHINLKNEFQIVVVVKGHN